MHGNDHVHHEHHHQQQPHIVCSNIYTYICISNIIFIDIIVLTLIIIFFVFFAIFFVTIFLFVFSWSWSSWTSSPASTTIYRHHHRHHHQLPGRFGEFRLLLSCLLVGFLGLACFSPLSVVLSCRAACFLALNCAGTSLAVLFCPVGLCLAEVSLTSMSSVWSVGFSLLFLRARACFLFNSFSTLISVSAPRVIDLMQSRIWCLSATASIEIGGCYL